MKVLIVDFGSQWTHRIQRTLKYLDADAKIIPVSTPLSEVQGADALVFSGGAIRISLGDADQTGNAREFLDRFQGPMLGVCAGQQFIGMHFGGKARPSAGPEFGKVELVVDDSDELFSGLPEKFTVWASHNDEVAGTPGFKVLAHSRDCSNHAFKSLSRPIYGTLFHPEVEHSEHGEEIYANFLRLAKK
jgi:GMP synthase (glutamine-hydrolysing)